ncbi:Crp/Fnr family transcriptional regulator [Solibacillus sp. FSL H8-0538]|uniref:Crp/Fnr family transcriptional regulator n=1 Tax=Solibacillus sp. FSL H8-0538 TaxID=2921400 RepID=UPI0030F65FA0
MKITQLFQEHGVHTKAEKGSHIFQEGERAESIFLIQSGTIQISKETESGKELTIRICSNEGLIGESLLFCKLNYHATTAKALEASELLVVHNDALELLLTEHPSLMMDYLKWIQTENMKNQSRLRDLVLHGKKGALFSTLIRLANTYGEFRSENEIYINYALTNTEMANLCATSREMINRMLNDLKKHGVITIGKGYITILDLQFLKDEIDCENCPLSICRID